MHQLCTVIMGGSCRNFKTSCPSTSLANERDSNNLRNHLIAFGWDPGCPTKARNGQSAVAGVISQLHEHLFGAWALPDQSLQKGHHPCPLALMQITRVIFRTFSFHLLPSSLYLPSLWAFVSCFAPESSRPNVLRAALNCGTVSEASVAPVGDAQNGCHGSDVM